MTQKKGTSGRIPVATYRLQFNHAFPFSKAREILAYLADLGVSDIYASPLFKAGPSSTHGYDVCSFEQINPNLGTEQDFNAFAQKLRESDMGLLLDVVPNHMGNDCSNAWLTDVLAKGKDSPYGSYFDIDWESNVPGLRGKILLPILEDHYAKVLEAGKLRLEQREDDLALYYYDRSFPLCEKTNEQLRKEIAADGLPRLLERYNGKPGDARSFDALHDLVQQQHYRLGHWRLSSQIINYRRFFDVTELIALRMESPEVFAAVHQRVLTWCKEGKVTGLRVDHPDGLFDPKEYFDRLQQSVTGNSQGGFYVVAEKILTAPEQLPADWRVDGTTGYDFLNQANGLFIDSNNESPFDRIYRDFAACSETFEESIYDFKKLVLDRSFGSELDNLSARLQQIAANSRSGLDLSRRILEGALKEIIAAFPVYRTYATRDAKSLTKSDRECVERAVRRAVEHAGPEFTAGIEFIGSLLSLAPPADLDESSQKAAREFVLRFQQLTGPVTANGVEDTAFYNYNRFVSLNEVGGNPGVFGVSPEQFHHYNQKMAQSWPHSLLSTATHDTKRGEDVRARLNVLSEMSDEWGQAVARWRDWNTCHKSRTSGNGDAAPDANDEYLLYQTLIGAWPEAGRGSAEFDTFRDRVKAYLLKAVRESKRHTSWTDQNNEYENGLATFIDRLLDESASNPFLTHFESFQRRVAFFGGFNSLSQTVLKLTSPGVPDVYQGTELWDLSMVDPDNRRPVDFVQRRESLTKLKQNWESGQRAEMAATLAQPVTAETKLFVTWRTLKFRKENRDLFENGTYLPLIVEGPGREHVCAFARKTGNKIALTLVPRLVFGLMEGQERLPVSEAAWGTTVVILPVELAGVVELQNIFTGESVRSKQLDGRQALVVATMLGTFPVCVLESVETSVTL
jgi:(1->4)-alpha-D-glucan 1-alpha-D-glucosylmutase